MSILDEIVEARRLSLARARRVRRGGGEAGITGLQRGRGEGQGESGAELQRERGVARGDSGAELQRGGGEARGRKQPAPEGSDPAAGSVEARPYGQRTPAGSSLAAESVEAPQRHRRSLEAALRAPGLRIIAEIKRRSPSAGILREDLDPAAIAAIYEHSGAAALSVLTEPDFFGGSDDDLIAARAAVSLPVLRKDFVLDAEQLSESRAIGADAVLLLASVHSAQALAGLVAAARREEIETLVEVHDERELDAALAAGARIVGVNSRDLRDFSVDLGRAEQLARWIPDAIVRVAESGLRTRDDLRRLEQAGYSAFLVGESLLRSPDPGKALRELLS